MADFATLAQQLVKFDTSDTHVAKAIDFLASHLRHLGFEVEIINYKSAQGNIISNLYASYGQGSPSLLLAGHLDVVSSGSAGEWNFPPFSGKIYGSNLYGRGIVDMKGALACFLAACEEFIRSPFVGSLSLIVSGDGEAAQNIGMRQLLSELAERGKVFDFCIVGEPSSIHKFGDEIKIGRRGNMRIEIAAYGKMGHPAYPDQASNPLHDLINLLFKLKSADLDDGDETFGPSTLQIVSLQTDNNPSNLLPMRAVAALEIYFNRRHTPDSLVQWLQNIVNFCNGQFELKYELKGEAYASDITPETEMLRRITASETGQNTVLSTGGGISEARFISGYCPVAELGLSSSLIHQVNEHVELEELYLLQRVYLQFIQEYFNAANERHSLPDVGSAV